MSTFPRIIDFFSELNVHINQWLWSAPLLCLLILGGLFLSFRFGYVQFRGFFHACALLFKGMREKKEEKGEISPFRALTTALAGTIGTGNVVGVAAAILIGGPGAIFWMWVSALVGMAAKFASCTLAVHFREVDGQGQIHGGPMYYIVRGLGNNYKWLAKAFAFFTVCASFGIGTMFQANNFTTNLHLLWQGNEGVEPLFFFRLFSGLLYAAVLALIIIGGVKKIGAVAGKIVPFMFLFYMVLAVTILVRHSEAIPGAFFSIFKYAFVAPSALMGGLFGTVIKQGFARGLFSNEAFLGSASIAHSAARTKSAARQGLIAMLGPFIDTLLVCTLTGLVILVTSALDVSNVKGELTSVAFRIGLGSYLGAKSISFIILLLAFSTTLSWSYYGDRASYYLFGAKGIKWYHLIYLLTVIIGACIKIDSVIIFSDTANGLMAICNLAALFILSPLVAKLTKNYFAEKKHSLSPQTFMPKLKTKISTTSKMPTENSGTLT